MSIYRHCKKIGRNMQHFRLWMSGVGLVLLFALLALTSGRAWADTISWSGWFQDIQGQGLLIPTVSTPDLLNYNSNCPPDIGGCPGPMNSILFVREQDDTLWYAPQGPLFGFTNLFPVPGNGVALNSPVAVNFKGVLYLFVQGTNNGLYMTTMNGSAGWAGHWTHVVASGVSAFLAASPEAVVYQNQLFVFERKADSSIHMLSSSDGSTWSESVVPGNGQTPTAPRSVVTGSSLRLLVQGTDGMVWVQTLNGTAWTGSWQQALVGQNTIPTTASPAAALSLDLNGIAGLEMFVRASNGSIQQYRMNSTDGSSWVSLGEVPSNGRTPLAPFAVDSPLSLFVQGTDGNVWENDLNVVPN